MIGANCSTATEADMVIFTFYSQFALRSLDVFPINILLSALVVRSFFYKVIWDLLNDDDSLDFVPSPPHSSAVAWAVEKKREARSERRVVERAEE
jgi:hypothetical protein